jgi:hypothetical protein
MMCSRIIETYLGQARAARDTMAKTSRTQANVAALLKLNRLIDSLNMELHDV